MLVSPKKPFRDFTDDGEGQLRIAINFSRSGCTFEQRQKGQSTK